MSDSGDIQWITVDGKHIPIGAGQTKDEAVKAFFDRQKKKKEDNVDRQYKQIEKNKEEADRLNEDRKTVSTQEEHRRAIEELSKDKYPDGTYNVANYKVVEYEDGYQVTFCQIGDNYSAKDYDDRVNEFRSLSSDGKVSAGKFEGSPEISFNVKDKATAIALAKKYNQISIWDWKEGNKDWRKGEIKTGGTGRRS